MNDAEFLHWTKHLILKLPEVGAWLHKQPKDEQQERLKDWRETLRPADEKGARAALDALYNEEIPMPRAFNRVPIKVRAFAMDSLPAVKDDEPIWDPVTKQWLYKCLECDDIGMVTVCRVETQVMMRDQPDDVTPKNFATCMVACNCAKGQRLSQRRKNPPPQYNERSMCRITSDAVTHTDGIEVLRQWLGDRPSRDISEHENFTEFGEFT